QVGEVGVHPDESNIGTRIQGMNTEDATLSEGTIYYDIRFCASVPHSDSPIRLILNVEAQRKYYPGYPLLKRGIYYCGRLLSAQKETEFTGEHYQDIKKVYSIWICTNPAMNRKNTITKYQMSEFNLVGHGKEERQYYDLLTVIMICLGTEHQENYNGVLKLLQTLLSPDLEANEKKSLLQNEFDIQMTENMESEVSIMCNLSDEIEERGIQKGKAEGITQGIAQGMAQGIAQGMAQGMAQGKLATLIQCIQKKFMTEEQAAQEFGTTVAEFWEQAKKFGLT
ncbi:MAG: hypothetical protein ACI4C1_10155, partial [Lachnospiraceae bacterium]